MIKNLQNQLNEAGKIKIGKKGKKITSKNGIEFRPPVKFDHFEIVTTEKDENDDYILDTELMDRLANSGLLNKNKQLIGIPIRLIYDDVEKNFPHRYVSYVKGKLACYGDGEVSKKRVDDFTKDHKCPCPRSESGYNGSEGKCKMTGTLTCVIDEAGLFGQAHVLRTTSANSVKGIVGSMRLLLKATGNRLAWLPLMLTLNEKNTTTPSGAKAKVYIVSLCFRGNLEDLRGKVLNLIGTDNQFLIEAETKAAAVPDIGSEDEQEFIDEFFPSEVDKTESIETETVVLEADEVTNEVSNEASNKADEVVEEILETPVTLSDDHLAQIIEPQGEALNMFNRFMSEETYDKAYSCARRLKKGHLLWWLANHQPNVSVDHKALKPEILEIVARYLTAKFKKEAPLEAPVVEEKTDAKEDPIEGLEFSGEWDDGPIITPEQLRMLIKQKSVLEQAGKITPASWVTHVNFFQDVNGGKVETAKKLTAKQGFTFIDMLDAEIVK